MTMSTAKDPEHHTPASIWGSELRYYREQAGLSQEELGDKIGWSRSRVQSAETGTRPPTADMATACDDALEAAGILVRLREKLLKHAALPPWFLPWIEIEQEAKALRDYTSVLVPGVLQTENYARVVLEGDEDAVAARMARQDILTKDAPPSIRCLLDEAVLSRPIGGSKIMEEQLERIEEVVASGQAQIQVSPSGSVPSVNGTFTLATLDGETLGYLEGTTQGMVLTKREDVLALEAFYEKILAEALPSKASLDTIRRMKEQWKT